MMIQVLMRITTMYKEARKGFLVIPLLLTGTICYAGNDGGVTEIKSAVLTGSQVSGDSLAPLEKDRTIYLQYSPVPGELAAQRKINNLVIFSINEETGSYMSVPFKVTANVRIEYGPDQNNTSIIDSTFTLTYDKTAGVKYNAKRYLSFENAAFVRITLLDNLLTSPSSIGSFDIRNVLVLENRMQITRYFQLSTNLADLSPSGFSSGTIQDVLPVNWTWPSAAGQNYTQLEWTWVEDELATYYYKNGVFDVDLAFAHNSTRVDLPRNFNSYEIPMYYDGTGKLYCRIRAVNIHSSGSRSDGPWSVPLAKTFGGHTPELNWQVRTSFAEEGKMKSVMEYFDGSLRGRQTVTKETTTNTVVVAETFYDRQGRPAIQVLPAPGMASVIAYTQNLNKFNGQNDYDDPADRFDFDVADLPGKTTDFMRKGVMNSSAQYYSDSNQQKHLAIHRNIPDAEGYPYTVTRYTPDATGRVLYQSGVGKAMRMGSGRETRYYYGSPSQEELDGLFGTDVGSKAHYFKNMVRDANGQMSVSYVDMHGRTIATALAGNAPDSLIALDYANNALYPNQAPVMLHRNLLDSSSNIIRGNSIESVSSLLVSFSTDYTFKYALTPESLQQASCPGVTPVSICYDCLYDLEISITDESGEQAPKLYRYNNISLDPDLSCNTGTPSFQPGDSTPNIIEIPVELTEGSYLIRKTLSISDSSLEKYRALFLQQNICKTEQELIDSIYNVLIQVTDCGNPQPVTCQSCLADLGTYASFKANFLAGIGSPSTITPSLEADIQEAYNSAKADCEKLCGNTSQMITGRRELMLADMIPDGGQYAKRDPLSPGSMYNKYDIFSVTSPGPQPFYRKPLTPAGAAGSYFDYSGQVDASIHPGGGNDYSLLQGMDAAAFAQRFTTSWATALLPYHPEYKRLQYAEKQMKGSFDWITRFAGTGSYDTALLRGYILTAGNNTATPYNDSFYLKQNSAGQDTLFKWVSSNYIQNLSLWQLAYGELRCKSITDETSRNNCYINANKIPPYTDVSSKEEKDQLWQSFRDLYITARSNEVDKYIAQQEPLADESALIAQGYHLRFATNSQLAAQNSWDWLPSAPGDLPGIPPASLQDSANQVYDNNCNGYINIWRDRLLECPAIAQHTDSAQILSDILAGMKTVCQKGSNAYSPFGASSVAPGTANDGSPKNFEEVIYRVFAQYGLSKTDFCNAYVIESPRGYGQSQPLAPAIALSIDDCNCARMRLTQTAADQAGYDPDNLSSFNQYLQLVYKDTITAALFAAFDHCHEVVAPGSQYILPQPQPVPAYLRCGFSPAVSCLDCNSLIMLIREFKDTIPAPYNAGPVTAIMQDEVSIRHNELLAKFLNYRTGFEYSWQQYLDAAAKVGCDLGGAGKLYPATLNVFERDTTLPYSYTAKDTINFLPGFTGAPNDIFEAYVTRDSAAVANMAVICRDTKYLTDTTGFFLTDPPCQRVYNMAVGMAQEIYHQRYESKLADFEMAYKAKCLSAVENFTVGYEQREYHYTLYYYDMAGSLVKTVPPRGVRPDFSKTFTDAVRQSRATGQSLVRPHELVTQYVYNSLNQVVAQVSPDGGRSLFWYDKLGRLVVSQNAQQRDENKYSYTLYDGLGRITEVGQKPNTEPMTQAISQYPASLNFWINENGAREQITITQYDRYLGYPSIPTLQGKLQQQNLRNRVSYTLVRNSSNDGSNYYAGTFYTYDIHGNVDTLLQHYKGVTAMNADPYKMIAYDYDLISGKVNGVDYQPDYDNGIVKVSTPDKFFHRYQYDAENRLVQVETSRDKLVWERDAAYRYYKHGPLARTELGQLGVQGVDYAYTLQGWLKGVNSVSAVKGYDMGADGTDVTAMDAYGFGLHYYDDKASERDYKPINGSTPVAFPRPSAATGIRSLYNGNIAAMSVKIINDFDQSHGSLVWDPLFYRYQYDQLNRLKGMKAYKGLANNQWTPVALDDYEESLNYDPNGNILSYKRNGFVANGHLQMDRLAYNYTAGTNRLDYVHDTVPSANYTEDIDAQLAGNYTYDQIGNLKTDTKEGITNITWTVYGKISSIVKGSGTITYTYDAAGNRITKTVGNLTTVYIRDAGGNVMSVYEKQGFQPVKQSEVHLYGSSRLGILEALTNAPVTVTLGAAEGRMWSLTRGEKFFELSNHLGNVLVTVSDKKIPVNNSTKVEYYVPDVRSASDYAPFGMGMVGRKFSAGAYRYGFNGQEKTSEIGSDGYTAESWQYDARLGRRWNVDPLSSEAPGWSPYRAFYCNPIYWVDPSGTIEYENAKAFADANKGKTWDKDRLQGDWLKSDRENNTSIWNNANKFNLQQKDGNLQYTSITQRAAFYGWFQKQTDAKGSQTNWAGAAYIIAQQMSLMDDPLIASMTDDAVIKFANDGNKAIFDDVFDNLRDLYNVGALKGDAAKRWDAATLTNEQRDVVQPIYARQTAETIKTLQALAQGTGFKAALGYMFDRRFPTGGPLKFEGNISNWFDRYQHGMSKAVPFYKKYGNLFNWNKPGDGRIDTVLDPDNPGLLKAGESKF